MNNSRLPLLVGLLALTLVGVVVAIVGLPDREAANTAPARQVDPRDAREVLPADDLPATEPDTAFSGPVLEVEPIPETPVVVASFPPARQVPLADWNRTGTVAGYFDGIDVLTDGGRAPLDPKNPVGANTRLVASGWSGDLEFGLPFRDVVLSQCDRLVGRAQVTLERPDVADAVHPNLERSGWEAVLYVGDLPNCADPLMRAWAVLPGKPAVLLPLNGAHRVGTVTPSAKADYHVAALPPLTPMEIAPLQVSMIDVTASRANLRRCFGTKCPRVGQVAAGRYRVHIASRRDGWSLLIFEDRAGWIADTLFKPAP